MGTKYKVVRGKKSCSICKRWLVLSHFYKNSAGSGGVANWCKSCHKVYRREPARWNKTLTRIRASNRTALGYFGRVINENRSRNRQVVEVTKEQLVEWDSKQPRICFYCDMPESLLESVNNFSVVRGTRYFRLTLDRKNDDIGYRIDNLVLCCPNCNDTKGNLFGYVEFKDLAMRFIKTKWEKIISMKKNKLEEVERK